MAELTWGDGLRTWYRVDGEGDATPVVICHGGPGGTHDYVEAIAALDRPCVLYDQVGNGRSSRGLDVGPEFWTVDLFLGELDALVAELGFGEYHVLGQSWGGMLAMEHALRHPAGLRSIVVADSPASIPLWVEEANRLRRELPEDVQAVLTRHEEAGTTDSPEYQQAMLVFYSRHVCRLPEWPEEVQRTFEAIEADPTVYGTMNGAERVPRRRLAARLGHHGPAGRDRRAHAARLRPLRRGDAADRRGDPPAHPRLALGAVRGVQPHAARGGALAFPPGRG
jgi:L-proline amide hydrolase